MTLAGGLLTDQARSLCEVENALTTWFAERRGRTVVQGEELQATRAFSIGHTLILAGFSTDS